jgi:hypothetical protein
MLDEVRRASAGRPGAVADHAVRSRRIAKPLGLDVPVSLFGRVDEVIE